MEQVLVARRVNFSHFKDFIYQTIRFIGCVKEFKIREKILILENENGLVNVSILADFNLPIGNFIEVFAKIQPNLSLKQVGPIIDLGTDLDSKIVNDTIELTFHPDIEPYFKPVENSDTENKNFIF